MTAVIRVLFLITDFDRGGAERLLYQIVRRLSRERFAPQVACLGGPGYYTEQYRRLNVPVHHLGLWAPRGIAAAGFPLALARSVFGLARLLGREHIEVVQTFLFHANMVGRLAGPLAGTPVVLGAVHTVEPRHWHTLLDGLTFPLGSGEVCVSEAVREFQAQRAKLPLRSLFVIPNGVDAADFSLPAAPFERGTQESLTRRRHARAILGLPPADPVFAFVGRLCEAKALPDLLSAFSIVAARQERAVLAIAGDGPLAPQLRAMVHRMALEGRVRLVGWLDDPGVLYSAADCFVLSSKTEGMPVAALEAMAAGLPLVTTDVAGCIELMVPGETGLLFRQGDVGGLASGMLSVLKEPDQAAQMGRQARERALGRFNLDRMVRRYEALYGKLLSAAYTLKGPRRS